MKYLRKFNESVDTDNLEDILLELEDMGIGSSYVHESPGHQLSDLTYEKSWIRISIDLIKSYNNNIYINWDDVKDCILRIKNYLGDRFIDFRCTTANEWNLKIELNEDTIIPHDTSIMDIKYKTSGK